MVAVNPESLQFQHPSGGAIDAALYNFDGDNVRRRRPCMDNDCPATVTERRLSHKCALQQTSAPGPKSDATGLTKRGG
jgi:hypothetical protein